MTRPFRVLMICTGNICRSPTAEGVLRCKLIQVNLHHKVEVASAGMLDYHCGAPPDARSQEAALRRGYDLSSQRARQVVVGDFERFDLVLGMESQHVEQLLAICPPQWAQRVGLLMDQSSERSPGRGVPDPYHGGQAGFEQVLDLIEEACDALIRRLQARLPAAE